MRKRKAYLTIYLTMILTAVLSLLLLLINVSRKNGASLEVLCIGEASLQSIFAEYHRELEKQYHLFAIDASYGTAVCSSENTQRHLVEYLEKNISPGEAFLAQYRIRDLFGLSVQTAELEKIQFITDGEGEVFRNLAIAGMKDFYGGAVYDRLTEAVRNIEVNGLGQEGIDKPIETEELEERLDDCEPVEISMENGKKVGIHSVFSMEANRNQGLIKLVFGEGQISEKRLNQESLLQNRWEQGQINQGNLVQAQKAEDAGGRFLFQQYIMKHMNSFTERIQNRSLDYQAEYVLCGKESDYDNLQSTLKRICMLREAANALYLYREEGCYRRAKATATVVCTLLLAPELTEVATAAIIAGWSFAESVCDLKTLVQGGSVPLFKDKDSWNCSLADAILGNWTGNAEQTNGLDYAEYLGVLLMLSNQSTITYRAMNLIEADIRLTPGNELFRLDGCISGLQVALLFESRYGYTFEMNRSRFYDG